MTHNGGAKKRSAYTETESKTCSSDPEDQNWLSIVEDSSGQSILWCKIQCGKMAACKFMVYTDSNGGSCRFWKGSTCNKVASGKTAFKKVTQDSDAKPG